MNVKYCKKCKAQIMKNTKVCPNCHAKQGGMPVWAIVLIVFAVIIVLGSIAGGSDSENSDSSTKNTTTKTETKKKDKNKPALNETFTFDDLEISVGDTISFTKVNNKFSEYHGKEVIKLPITVKNKKDESYSLNIYYYKTFGPNGTEVKNMDILIDAKDSLFNAGELRPEASYTKYIYFLYDGDGKYAIEFDDWSTKKTVEFDVKKN